MSLRKLRSEARAFRDARDWRQFHSARNMAVSISIEAAELLELFQWKTDAEAETLGRNRAARARIADEMADIFLYLLLMSDDLGIDLIKAANRKILKNARKYPVRKARGKAVKYTEL